MNLQDFLEAAIKDPQPSKLAEIETLVDKELTPYKHKQSNYRSHMESLLKTLKAACAKVKPENKKVTSVSNFFT